MLVLSRYAESEQVSIRDIPTAGVSELIACLLFTNIALTLPVTRYYDSAFPVRTRPSPMVRSDSPWSRALARDATRPGRYERRALVRGGKTAGSSRLQRLVGYLQRLGRKKNIGEVLDHVFSIPLAAGLMQVHGCSSQPHRILDPTAIGAEEGCLADMFATTV